MDNFDVSTNNYPDGSVSPYSGFVNCLARLNFTKELAENQKSQFVLNA